MGGNGCSKSKNELTSERKKRNRIDNKNMYNFVRIIGKGGFGRVWKVTDKKSK